MPAESELLATRLRAHSGRALAVSLAVHGLLIVAACWIVFRQGAATWPKAEFISHQVAGGRSGHAEAKSYAVSRPPPKVVTPRARLATKSATASLVLPEMKMPSLKTGLGAQAGKEGGLFGRGRGLGGSTGLGSGLGLAKGFVGRPVMGALIKARRVAVYLDCSGSMRSYLTRVEAEIRKEFPDADVFRFDGARVVGLGDSIVYGRSFHGSAPRLREGPTQTVVESLTPSGRALQARIRRACEQGSLGAWLDRLLAEPYEALVVFSDFQDGVRLYEVRKGGEPHLVFSDSSYRKFGTVPASRTRWQREWLEAFTRAGKGAGPRLYLFTVQQEPQPFLQACVVASGGASTSVSWLRKGAKPASP